MLEEGILAVREVAGEAYPVLIDFKSLTRRLYPLQFWLFFKELLSRKIQRRFQRMREMHQIS